MPPASLTQHVLEIYYQKQYIVRLVGRVISVSLETVRIVEGLPALEGGEWQGE